MHLGISWKSLLFNAHVQKLISMTLFKYLFEYLERYSKKLNESLMVLQISTEGLSDVLNI